MLGILSLSLFSAFLCAASLPNEVFLTGLWPVGFVCLIPLYMALRRTESHSQAALDRLVYSAACEFIRPNLKSPNKGLAMPSFLK